MRWILLIALCASFSSSAAERFSDWEVQSSQGMVEIFTGNTSGSMFGALCSESGCVYYLDINIGCTIGETYPILVNADPGSSYFQMKCIKFGDKTIYGLENSEKIINAVYHSEQIGFAMPLQSGQFNVSRFSLRGYKDAALRATTLRKNVRFHDSIQ